MKRSSNKLFFGALLLIAATVGAINVAAQDTTATPDPAAEKTALYTKFGQCFKAQDEPAMTACITAGEEYMSKFGTPPDPPYSEFVSKQLANLKTRKEGYPLRTAYDKFDKAITGQAWKDAFDAGRDVIRLEKDESKKLDMTIYLAELGYSRAFATPPDTANTAEAINYAKSAINMINAGTASQPRKGANNTQIDAFWGGPGNYSLKSKEAALAWSNFIIARLVSDTNKDASKTLAVLKEAAPYYYNAMVKYNAPDIRTSAIPYQSIGLYYLEELNAKVDEYDRTCKTLTELTDQCKTILGMQRAFAERGIDAYARAAKLASTDPKSTPAYKDSLSKKVSAFYLARFKKTDGQDAFVATLLAKPMADPATPPPPIDEDPVPATTTTTSTTSTTPPATTGTKPATAPASTVKPGSTSTTPASTVKPATTPASTGKPAATPAKPNGAAKGTVAKMTSKKKTGR